MHIEERGDHELISHSIAHKVGYNYKPTPVNQKQSTYSN